MAMSPIEIRAAQWILQRDRAEFTPEQRAALESWLAEDGRHREAYLKFHQAWLLSAGLKSYRAPDGHRDLAVLDALASTGARRSRSYSALLPRSVWAGMAALVLATVLATAWFLWPPGERYATAVGGYERVLLDDGSVIQLNTDTQLRVRYTPERREIDLDRGEVYFDVAHHPARPFIVTAANSRIVAVGTQFSVRKDADDIRVSVTDGTVRLEGAGATAAAPAPHLAAAQLLPAGSIAVGSKRGILRVAHATITEVEQQLAWRSGLLIFKNRPLAEIVAEFNRYNRQQLHIADPGLAALTIDGNFKPNDLESFLAALHTLNIETTRSDHTIEVSRP